MLLPKEKLPTRRQSIKKTKEITGTKPKKVVADKFSSGEIIRSVYLHKQFLLRNL